MEVPMVSERGTADARGARSRAEKDERCPGGVLSGAVALRRVARARGRWRRARRAALTLVPAQAERLLRRQRPRHDPEFNEFAELIGKHPALLETFHPWGNSLNQAYERWRESATRPMLPDLHRGRPDPGRDDHPAADRAGRRRRLPAAAQRVLRQTRPARLHPAAGEPNRCLNAWSAVNCDGTRGRRTHPGWYKQAFRRIVAIVRGGRRWKGSTRPWPKSACRRSPAQGPNPTSLPAAPVSIIWSPLPAARRGSKATSRATTGRARAGSTGSAPTSTPNIRSGKTSTASTPASSGRASRSRSPSGRSPARTNPASSSS